jgi:TPR repeat protein
MGKTDEEEIEELMKRVEVNDAAAICVLAHCYFTGLNGVQQDQVKAMELYARAADLGYSKAHYNLANIYGGGGSKKAKLHYEAASMAGNVAARCNIGTIEAQSENMEHGASCEALNDCCISWGISGHG